jgi:formate hydrogenlyase subunit 6/NADH:ubiquinone oxidoreductase subunit I
MANPFRLPMVPRSLRNLVSRPATRLYPKTPRPQYDGGRGTILFDVETCNYCMLCMRRCPAAAINVVREDRMWSIEHLTCIGCNVCVEVCARKSLTMSPESKHVHVHAEVGPQGQRPGHEEWHGPDPAVVAAAKAAAAPATAPAPEPAG